MSTVQHRLAAQDVTNPWTGPTVSTLRSSFTARSIGRGFRVDTPLDGTFRVTLNSPAKTAFTLRLVDPTNGNVLGSWTGADRVKSVEVQVCGQRTLQAQVKRVRGAGTFSLTISKP